jgi:hypothetical protein
MKAPGQPSPARRSSAQVCLVLRLVLFFLAAGAQLTSLGAAYAPLLTSRAPFLTSLHAPRRAMGTPLLAPLRAMGTPLLTPLRAGLPPGEAAGGGVVCWASASDTISTVGGTARLNAASPTRESALRREITSDSIFSLILSSLNFHPS